MLQFSQQICSFAHTNNRAHILASSLLCWGIKCNPSDTTYCYMWISYNRETHAVKEEGGRGSNILHTWRWKYHREFRCEIIRCLLITLYLHCTHIETQQQTRKVNAHQMGINLISMENLSVSPVYTNTIVPCSFIHSVTQNKTTTKKKTNKRAHTHTY